MLSEQETQPIGARARKWSVLLIAGGAIALIAGLVSTMVLSEGGGLERFGFSYLIGFVYAMSIALGSLLLVLLTTLFRAGWVIVLRRVLECHAAAVCVLAILFIPILIYVFSGTGSLYPWAEAEGHGASHVAADVQIITVANAPEAHAETNLSEIENEVAISYGDYGDAAAAKENDLHHMVEWKSPYLNPMFFTLRWMVYLAVWSILGFFFLRTSMKQDETKDITLTNKREKFAPAGTILFAFTMTFACFDLMMSLDPTWYSTMYGVYFFSGSMIAAVSTLILVVMGLEKAGVLTSVTTEHYHDLGKLLLTFIIFWAYIAYSQYMLIWYGPIPAEQPWPIIRGMSTVHETPYQYVAVFMLLFHFFVPFLFMMSRHIKRNKLTLAIGAVWMLVVHGVDMFWLVMPEYRHDVILLPVPEVLCIIGATAVLLGVAAGLAAKANPVPTGDPRLKESLDFTNY